MPGKVASLFQPQGEAEVTETAETVGVEGGMWDRPLEMEIAQIDDRQFGSGRSFKGFQDGLHPEV